MANERRASTTPTERITYRGTTLGPNALGQIGRVIREARGLRRHEIARRVCLVFDWRRRTGELAVESCRHLLGTLERRGLIKLPPLRPRRRALSERRPRPMGTGFECPDPSCAGLLVRPIRMPERESFWALMDRHHYLGFRSSPGETVFHVAFFACTPVALLAWSGAALHNPPRDAWIGWDTQTRCRHLHLVANNVRFLILPGAREAASNLASRVLGASVSRLSGDFQSLYAHPILLAETFVDISKFRGTCYLAANWVRLGMTSGWSKRGRAYVHNGQEKDALVYPLHRRAREWLAAQTCPFDGKKEERNAMLIDVSKLPIEGNNGLFEVIQTIADPRKRRGVRHSIASLVALGVTAVLAGSRSLVAIAQWVEDLPGDMRVRLGGSRWRSPSEPTFRRVFAKIDVPALERKVGEWIAGLKEVAGEGIALDGKTLRGSRRKDVPGVHLVSAVMHRDGTVLSQTRVPDKSNEIKSVEPVLEDLGIEGAVVTGDAMFAQTNIATHIVEEKKADYLLTVKDNQPGIKAKIEAMGMESFSPSLHPKQPRARTDRSAADLGG